MKPIAVYSATNQLNGKMYIGQTVRPERRFAEHTWKGSKSKILSLAIKKYGKSNFVFDILCWCPDKEYADYVEQKLIEAYDTRNVGYNICIGGEGFGSGEAHPCFGRVASIEQRKVLSESKKGGLNPMFGKENTPEQKEKIRQSLLGRDITWGDKISAAKKGVRAPNQKLTPMVAKKDGELFYYPSVIDCANAIGVKPEVLYRWMDKENSCTTGWVVRKAAEGDDPYASVRDIEYVKPKLGQARKIVCRNGDIVFHFGSLVDAAVYLGTNVTTIRRWLKGRNVSKSGWIVEHDDGH